MVCVIFMKEFLEYFVNGPQMNSIPVLIFKI